MSHQRNNPQVSRQTRITGQRLVALIAGVVVLLIAFTFIGISQASRLGASAPQLPPAKATLLARADATMAAARARNPHPTKPAYTPPAAVPTATFTSGIYYNDGQDKFPNFSTNDMYRGQVNGVWEFIYVGSDVASAAAGVGAVRVETFSNATGFRLVGVFDATDHSTGIDITGIKGNILQLKSDKTASFGFDLMTNTFTS